MGCWLLAPSTSSECYSLEHPGCEACRCLLCDFILWCGRPVVVRWCQIDGVDALNNILLIGMTNRKDMLDEALLRCVTNLLHASVSVRMREQSHHRERPSAPWLPAELLRALEGRPSAGPLRLPPQPDCGQSQHLVHRGEGVWHLMP